MKEEYSIPVDDSFYIKSINDFIKAFKEVFGKEMILKSEHYYFKHMGGFSLTYNYIPMNYIITIENELRTFTITMEDSEKARNFLHRIEKFDNKLCETNIKNQYID